MSEPYHEGAGQLAPKRRRPSLTDHWILLTFGAFCLAVLAANGVMIALAITTWPGLATTDAYRKGIAYNQALAAAREQAALGWRAELAFRPKGERRGRLELRLADASGRPVERAEVRADLVRPAQGGQDFATFLGSDGSGTYATEVEFPLAGTWDVRLRAGDGRHSHQLTRRIVVP